MKTTDTDGILDRCHCGAHAGFETYSTECTKQRAFCTECAEQTGWFVTKVGAMIAWNKLIRAIKANEKK